jgi:hypothetical protein
MSDTKVVKAENLVAMFADLEAALWNEIEIHGDNADLALVKAVAHWATELREAGLLGDYQWKSTVDLMNQAGWPVD